jgi:hypothetical protein
MPSREWPDLIVSAIAAFNDRDADWPRGVPRPKIREVKRNKSDGVDVLIHNAKGAKGPFRLLLTTRVFPLSPDSGVLIGDGGGIDGHLKRITAEEGAKTLEEMFVHVLDEDELPAKVDTLLRAFWITGLAHYGAQPSTSNTTQDDTD